MACDTIVLGGGDAWDLDQGSLHYLSKTDVKNR
jgi:hypothetical protein